MLVVLYIDNLFFVAALDALLRQLGHDVRVATTPSQAVEMLASAPQLIIADLHAPEALSVIAKFSPSASTVAFCGHTEVELRKQAKQAGVEVLLPNSELTQALPKILAKIELQVAAKEASRAPSEI